MSEKTVTLACRFLHRVADMLIEKDVSYGESIAKPIHVFSKLPPIEGVRVRIDDKIKRVAFGDALGEDVICDFVGYLAFLWALQEQEKQGSTVTPPDGSVQEC